MKYKKDDEVVINHSSAYHEFTIGEIVKIKTVYDDEYYAISNDGWCCYITDEDINYTKTNEHQKSLS